MSSRNDSSTADALNKPGPLNSSPGPSDPHRTQSAKMLSHMQSRTANKSRLKDDHVEKLEQEFKYKHLSLLGVFVWIL